MTTPKQPFFWLLVHLLALALSFLPHACTVRTIGKHCNRFTLCGNLNISHPFRLKSHHHSCGLKVFELVCDNNRTILSGEQGNFYVQHISYVKYTIHLVDVNLYNHYCSLPHGSLPLRYSYNGKLSQPEIDSYAYYNYSEVYVVKCSRKMKKSWSGVNYIDASRCSSSPPTNDLFYYFLDGKTAPSDLHTSCTVDARVPINLHNISDASTFDIYKKLMMGVQLRWSPNIREGYPWLQWNSVVNV
ncbi:uncharacterized protein LOC120160593 [Hibiscus syriacus]|uniref:uncharacterized protein LOC120160593 n=1 Tax=Hibiscus syriacus TaxID=106335 RepID=UPI0019251281|nr:uncharacterized protein LOC120160593 [Hibiscus syriacus]